MSATYTPYARDLMQRALWCSDEFVPMTEVMIVLTLTVPVAGDGVGDLIEPPAASGYTRTPYPTIGGMWSGDGFAEISNAAVIACSMATADWGLVCGFALIDEYSGQTLVVGSMDVPYVANAGMIPKLDAGAISLGLVD